MLDENLPTFRFKPSSDNPLNTLLYFSHHGSDPAVDYIIKRPTASSSQNQYALGIVDAQYNSAIYGEVMLDPEWSQPTLSAAEVRANGGTPPAMAITPDSFSISLYNPDQSVHVKQHAGSWGKSDSWEFELPVNSFKLPSASRIDQESAPGGDLSELVPRVVFRWKRDGRMSRDMTCYLTGMSVAGKKSKEPDITVALFRGKDSTLTIYEPNMARVDVEDRKGLEVVLLMSAEIIRDLYLSPRPDPFNTGGGLVSGGARRRTNSRPTGSPPAGMTMAGAQPPPSSSAAVASTQPNGGERRAEIEAETKRLQEMVAKEQKVRERRDAEEQQRIKQMLEQEETDRRQREAEIEQETERLRREYGVQGQSFNDAGGPPVASGAAGGPTNTSPSLPPRPTFNGGWYASGGASGMPSNDTPRPSSVGPAAAHAHFAPPPTQPTPQQNGNGSGEDKKKKKHGLGSLLQGPYAGPAAASVSGFFGGGKSEEEKKKKMLKKRSVHF